MWRPVAEDTRIPLLEHEPTESPVFTAANLLEAARIRKGLPKLTVPAGCLLDFDGELVQHLADTAWWPTRSSPKSSSNPGSKSSDGKKE